MQAMIDNFRILPAGHCGSGSMRNLIYHYCKLDLDEAVIFGLGAGLDSIFFRDEHDQPPFKLFGRSLSMEADLALTLGIDYEERIQTDDDQAWEEVKAEVVAGRPTMLSGDIYYLDYREFKVHFPGHRFILVGFDEDKQEVFIADRVNAFAERCSMAALRQSRNANVGLGGRNLWGKFNSSRVQNSLPEACGRALKITVERMQGLDSSQRDRMSSVAGSTLTCATGLDGLKLFRQEMAEWPGYADVSAHLQYLDSTILKFGTGGGFFRDHFAKFIHWSRQQRPDLVSEDSTTLAVDAAAQWNALPATLAALALAPADSKLWAQALEQVDDIYHTEYLLFGQLGDTVLR